MLEYSKKLILKIGAVLLCTLLLLTFFSNTIYSLGIAGVTAGFTSDGVIMRTYRTEGVVDFSENLYLYADIGGKISLNVREGDTVSEGTKLFTLNSDVEDLRDRLLSETNRLEKLEIDMEQIRADLRYRQNILDSLAPEENTVTEVPLPDTDAFDYEMNRLAAEIANAEEEYDSLQKLFDAGAATRETLINAESVITSLKMEYRRNEEKKEKAIKEYETAVLKAAEEDNHLRDEKLKEYETQRQSAVKAIEDLRYRLDSCTLDENEARRAIELYNKQIEAGGVVTVLAEGGGVVREIPDGVENGAYVDRNRLVIRLGVVSALTPYRTIVLFPESADFISEGGNVKLNIKSRGQYGIDGVIEKLGFENGRLRAEVVFDAVSLVGGERVEAVAELVSELFDKVLPNSAIRKDADGDYILYAERVPNSMMGYSYYARRVPVYIIMQDERKTAVSLYSDIIEPIIINSDRPVSNGDRIRLVNENELVETR